MIERACSDEEADLGRPARQRRRDPAGAGAARRAAGRRDRPDLGARPDQRLSAGGLDAGRMGGAARAAIPRRSSRPREQSMAVHVRAMLDFHARGHADARLRQQHPPDGEGRGRRRRLRLSRLRAGLYPPAVLPRHRPVPLGGAVRRSGGHLPHRRQGEGADARTTRICTTGSTWRRTRIQLPGPAGAHLLGRAWATATGWASPSTRWWRSGELKAPIVIGRDHLDSGSVASPNRETEAMRDGSDAVSDWPLLNALLNCASRRDLGVAPPRRRRRHGLFAACRHGDRLRRHAGRGAAHRARAVERPGDRRHAPRRCRLRGRDRVRAGSTGLRLPSLDKQPLRGLEMSLGAVYLHHETHRNPAPRGPPGPGSVYEGQDRERGEMATSLEKYDMKMRARFVFRAAGGGSRAHHRPGEATHARGQQAPRQRPSARPRSVPHSRPRRPDPPEDGRFAMIKETLKLNDAQLKLWSPVEENMRNRTAERQQQRQERRSTRPRQDVSPSSPCLTGWIARANGWPSGPPR